MSGDEFESRLADLEARYAFLDDLVHHLDGIVADQQRTIESLRDELRQTRESLKSAQHEGPEGPEPPPPHY